MKVDIDKIYFGIKMPQMGYTSLADRSNLKSYNLFSFSRVKWSVAKYVTMTKKERESLLSDPLHFCFGDTQARCEFEFIVCPFPPRDTDNIEKVGMKVDVFGMYVKPNADYLMYIVNSISKKSAKRYLAEETKRRGWK